MSTKLSGSVIVECDAEQVYRMGSRMEGFPRFMRHIKSVIPMDRFASRWVREGPMGRRIEWDARIIGSEPNRRIAREALRGDLWMADEIRLKPRGKGRTELTVSIRCDSREGIIGRVDGMRADPQGDLEADSSGSRRMPKAFRSI